MVRYTDVLRRRLDSSLALARGLYPDRSMNKQLRPEMEAARRLLALYDAAKKLPPIQHLLDPDAPHFAAMRDAEDALDAALRYAEEECPDEL